MNLELTTDTTELAKDFLEWLSKEKLSQKDFEMAPAFMLISPPLHEGGKTRVEAYHPDFSNDAEKTKSIFAGFAQFFADEKAYAFLIFADVNASTIDEAGSIKSKSEAHTASIIFKDPSIKPIFLKHEYKRSPDGTITFCELETIDSVSTAGMFQDMYDLAQSLHSRMNGGKHATLH